MGWKEINVERKKKKKMNEKKDTKPFDIKHYRFFPCCWSKSIKEGYMFFLLIRKHNAYLPTHELDSPRFKTKQEAINFAQNNIDTSFIPA